MSVFSGIMADVSAPGTGSVFVRGFSFTDPEGLGNLHQAASVEDTCFEALVKSFGKRDIRVCRVAPDYKLEAVAVITGLMHT